MKTDVIYIDNKGTGFDRAMEETKKAALYRGLDHKQTLHLQLIAEEMLSMAHSITGEMEASFWVESEGKTYELYDHEHSDGQRKALSADFLQHL